MTSRPSFISVDFGPAQASFRLLWDEAPETCAAVVSALPYSGEASHATCSGPAGVVFFETELPVMPENATTTPGTGELLYTYYAPGWRQHYPEHTSEIYWFYPPGGRPTVPGMFVPAMASVFAEPVDRGPDLQALFDWTASLHREGWKPVTIEVG